MYVYLIILFMIIINGFVVIDVVGIVKTADIVVGKYICYFLCKVNFRIVQFFVLDFL